MTSLSALGTHARLSDRRFAVIGLLLLCIGMACWAGPASAAEARSLEHACPKSEVPEDGFNDVSDENVHEFAIDCATWRELAHGRNASEFAPAGTATRAQVASFAARLIMKSGGSLPNDPADHFTDDNHNVHEHAINQLADVGIVQGKGSSTTYLPAANVTRAQLATLLIAAVEYHTGYDLTAPRDYFNDDEDSVHEWNINTAAYYGVAAGTSEHLYSPQLPVRRDAAASFLVRTVDLLIELGRRLCPAQDPAVSIIEVIYDAPGGDDVAYNAGEYVELLSCDPVDVTGWYLEDAQGNRITIATGYTVTHKGLRIYTGPGDSTPERYFAGHSAPVWDDTTDTVSLYTSDGRLADQHQY